MVATIFTALQELDVIAGQVAQIASTLPQFTGFVGQQSQSLNQLLQQLTAMQSEVNDLQVQFANNQQLLQAIIAGMATSDQQAQIVASEQEILKGVQLGALDVIPVSVRLIVPTFRNPRNGEVVKMATNLINDMISTIHAEFDNVSGQAVPAPTGDKIAVSAVDATGAVSTVCTVALNADGMSVDVTPTPSDGTNTGSATIDYVATLADGTVLTAPPLAVTFTANAVAANVHLLTTGITTRPIGT